MEQMHGHLAEMELDLEPGDLHSSLEFTSS